MVLQARDYSNWTWSKNYLLNTVQLMHQSERFIAPVANILPPYQTIDQ